MARCKVVIPEELYERMADLRDKYPEVFVSIRQLLINGMSIYLDFVEANIDFELERWKRLFADAIRYQTGKSPETCEALIEETRTP